jgi:hypothetical protein
MDEQITQLDRRLIVVETAVAASSADAVTARSYQTSMKEDIAKVDAKVSVIQSNYVTKEDLAKLETRVAVIQSNYSTKEDLAELRLQVAKLEVRMVRWAIATMIVVSGVVVSGFKILP